MSLDALIKRAQVEHLVPTGMPATFLEQYFKMQALAGDLSVHIQNRCLGKLLGNRLAKRATLALPLPRIVEGQDGSLQLQE